VRNASHQSPGRVKIMNAVLLDANTLGADIDLAPLYDCVPDWDTYPLTFAEHTLARIKGAGCVFSNKVVLQAEHFQACPSLQYIGILATGTNNVDLVAAKAHNITVTNVVQYATPAVVQHTFNLILSLYTQQTQYVQAVKHGDWSRSSQFCLLDYPVREIAGKTLVIVGYGELGQGVAQVAQAFGMTVKIAQRPGTEGEIAPSDGLQRQPLYELLPHADILSLHCPLTPQTEKLINVDSLALMKPDAVLINTARGGLIDETALANALQHGKIGGAALDTLSSEPPSPDNPLLSLNLPNLLITPHTAWASREARQRLIDQAADNFRAFLRGDIQGVQV